MKLQPNISLYWKCQIIGWSIAPLYWGYIAYTGTVFSLPIALLHFFTDVIICISITHLFRIISKKYHWHELKFQNLLIRIIPTTLLLSFLYMIISIVKLYLVHMNFREDFTQS